MEDSWCGFNGGKAVIFRPDRGENIAIGFGVAGEKAAIFNGNKSRRRETKEKEHV